VGGPIALVAEDDLIHLDVADRKLEIVGLKGREAAAGEVAAALTVRAEGWKQPAPKLAGALGVFKRLAAPTASGSSILLSGRDDEN
jgi:dihydroxy-acid dehydratase